MTSKGDQKRAIIEMGKDRGGQKNTGDVEEEKKLRREVTRRKQG